jgi:hypothetical protein
MLFLSLFFTIACTPEKTADSAEPKPKPVLAEITLIDAIQGDVMGNVTLTSTLDTQTTNSEGKATILVDEEQAITIEASVAGYMPHLLELYSGRINYSAVSLVASRNATSQIYSLLSPSISVDSTKGVIIVALDNPDLSPAVGATASISTQSDDPFVLTSISASYGNEVVPNAGGFVAFPNVEAGATTITVQSPEETTCVHHPSGNTEQASITVQADAVHVVFFMCSP